ncbi:MAG: hypothetical protein JXA55_03705 [Bacteroidales bacterium]|nr:hypothetical protein [Bacteroidales bacterium]
MRILLSFAFAMISAGLLGQANFAGTWAFNESKSNFGESQFRFAATTMVVTVSGNVLSVESTMPGRDGEVMKTNAKYNIDGTASENPMFNSTRKSTVTWSADKNAMTIASTMTFEMNGESRTMNTSETWKLAEGGKVLLIESTRRNRDGGEMKTVAAYDKK